MPFCNTTLKKFVEKNLPDMVKYMNKEYDMLDVWTNLTNGLPFKENYNNQEEDFDEPIRYKAKLIKGKIKHNS
jgi:hypothetical protein